jgi:hypothetical protein
MIIFFSTVDGDVMAGVPRQLRTVPNDTDVLVLSIGGNDGLRYLRKLQSIGMHNPLNVVSLLNEAWTEFSQSYGDTLDKTIALGKKVSCVRPCVSSCVCRVACRVACRVVGGRTHGCGWV